MPEPLDTLSGCPSPQGGPMTDPNESVRCGRCQTANASGAQRCQQCHSFLAGSAIQLVHGARQGKALERTTTEALAAIEAVLVDQPGSEPRFGLARRAAARALARVELLTEHVDSVGVLD